MAGWPSTFTKPAAGTEGGRGVAPSPSTPGPSPRAQTQSAAISGTLNAVSIPEQLPDLTQREARGSKTLLLGNPGSGKTSAIATLVQAGLEVGVLITDPGGEESLYDAMERLRLPLDRLHTKYIPPASADFTTILDLGKKVSAMDYASITTIKSGIGKSDHQQFLQVIDTCNNFIADRSGVRLGPVDSWGPDRAFVIDSATGLNVMCMALMIGAKPGAHQGEWGVAMNMEEQFIMKLCSDLRCFFVLTAHIEREMDETQGKPMRMAAFLGRKLAPKIPRLFSDVIEQKRDGTKHFWSTVGSDIDLKQRNIAAGADITPSFVPLVENWRRRQDKIAAAALKQKEKAAT